MGNLQNKLISQTYDALIQTGTDEPVDGTLRPLQDGSGQTLPVEISTSAVNFTGTVTGTPDTTYTLDKSYVGSALSFNLNGSDTSLTSIAISPGTGIDLVATSAGARIDSTVTDTTYDYGAVGAAGNINIALTGSDTTNDVVTMQAGTNITLTDNGSNTFTIDAAGGGGGGMEATLLTTGRGVNMNGGVNTSHDLFKTTYVPDTYGTASTTINNNQMKVVAMPLITGQDVSAFGVYITSATAGGTIKAVLYKAATGASGNLVGGDIEYEFGDIDATTTGLKVISGAAHTLGATVDNTYFLAIWNNSGSNVGVQACGSTNMSGLVSHMSMYASTAYRGTTFARTYTTLPTNIGESSLWQKATDFPIYGLKFA
jgi:hypothetical protein